MEGDIQYFYLLAIILTLVFLTEEGVSVVTGAFSAIQLNTIARTSAQCDGRNAVLARFIPMSAKLYK